MIIHVGVEIGTLPNEQHQISGTLHVLDSTTLYIEDFNYDGGGPGEGDIIRFYKTIVHDIMSNSRFGVTIIIDT